MVTAYYDDGTGLCFWCCEAATADWCGVPLCDRHAAEEMQEFMQWSP
jgi:hypothetical protein